MVKTELILKINDSYYCLDDIVCIAYSDMTICSGAAMNLRLPINQKNIKGRIVRIYDDSINVDCSTEYNSNEERVYFEEIINISKI